MYPYCLVQGERKPITSENASTEVVGRCQVMGARHLPPPTALIRVLDRRGTPEGGPIRCLTLTAALVLRKNPETISALLRSGDGCP